MVTRVFLSSMIESLNFESEDDRPDSGLRIFSDCPRNKTVELQLLLVAKFPRVLDLHWLN